MNKKDQDFGELKTLLKLKRHEVPPVGYFSNFSAQIIAKIQAGEADEPSRSPKADAPWLVRFFEMFTARPAVIGGLAASLCGLLILGAIFAEQSEPVANNFLTVSVPTPQPQTSDLASISSPALAPAPAGIGIVAKPTPVTSLQPVANLFGQPNSGSLFQVQPASFAPAIQ